MERHFEHDLEHLKERLLRMGSLVERAIHQSVQALLEVDGERAQRVIAEEKAINDAQIEIDEEVLRILALYQLLAADLRFALAVGRINADLERMGDQAVNIAEAVTRILRYPRVQWNIDLARMTDAAATMVHDSLDAFVQGNVELARSVLARDDAVDAMRDEMFKELLAYMMSNASMVFAAFDLILVAKYLERIADHATNIAEDVIYVVEGHDVRHHALDPR